MHDIEHSSDHVLLQVRLILGFVMLLQKPRPHIFGMTASPVNTRPQDTEMKLTQTMQQLERNLDAQIITVINRDPVIAAAPLPELKLVNYSCKHDSDAVQELQGGHEG